jgi:hypothetical protein
VLHAFQPTDGPRRRRAPRTRHAASGSDVARVYWCAACRTRVATESDAIEVAGAHQHTFTNPAGERFTIGCFREANGCRIDGEPTLEHTWFAGHVWSYASCRNCGAHLGWYFDAGEARFFGLILARLFGPM